MASDSKKVEAFEWLVKKSKETAERMGNDTSETKIREHCKQIAERGELRHEANKHKIKR